jgi:hypothetical protein
VIDFSGATVGGWEDSDGFIEAGGDKFSTCRSEVDIKDGTDVIFVYHLGLIWLSEIKCITVRIFISNHQVHGLLRIPAKG